MIKSNNIKDIYLSIGDFFWGGPNSRVTTILGSCVSICVWHPQNKIGGICHYTMPGRREKRRENLNPKYGDDAMWMMLEKIEMSKTAPKEFIVKIFGGASVVYKENMIPFLNVGERNIISAVERLKKAGLSIQAENVGGNRSRKLCFELWSGDIWMKKFG